ncbi:type II toxin-antitoxin system TacA family antitoxin [Rhizobium herbae]|uniref:Uncharacterized protein (DUF1778 family) n=1 Tax=Rhizobium herbae TaxID=508661 RepID=A0ABS4EPD3_9HYPH|nr:DUF1778 domain-containing protein [Rhizobium herbae]MBP1859805.1 uncharacterized protein (DUF1778 family) [Rhizobium herbae]
MTTVRKNEIVNLRMDANTRDVITRAAKIRGKSLTAFMTEAAYQSAQKDLLEQQFLGVDASVFDAVETVLSQPGRVRPELVELFKTDLDWAD